MSGWNNWSIRRKLFSIIIMILVLNLVVLLTMGSALFEKFYQANKVSELKKSADVIRDAYAQNSETFYDDIGQIENRNTIVSLFSISATGELETQYHSRVKKMELRPSDGRADFPRMREEDVRDFNQAMVERLRETGADYYVTMTFKQENGFDDSITLSVELEDNLYLYMQTPRGYIKSTADLAVQYTALLSIGILLVGAVAVYFTAGRITRPIRQIQEIADQLAHLDFSQKCVVRGKDELAMLGTSINNMSAELQTSIEKLIEANVVLQNDLVRQQQTDRMRQQFVASVSHDFKTPLTLIISYAEALSETAPAPQEQDYCETIIGEGNKLSRMVGKLLGLSKLENGIDKVETSIFCLDEILDGVLQNHRILTEKRGITVTRCKDEAFIVFADYQKIEQVITNLVENAVKYTPDGGEITVTARRMGERCRVTVENTGSSIGADDLASIFDSFYRADQSRADGQSYGLGLAIVKATMEAHEQAYGAENIEDGVRVWFELQLADMDDEEDS